MTNNVNKVNAATQAELDAHTEQALIELVYVRTANELLGTAMGNLDSALNTTRSVINILTALQNLKNEISVSSKSAFGFDYFTGLYNGKGIFINDDDLNDAISQTITRQTLLPTGSTRRTANFTSGAGSRGTLFIQTNFIGQLQTFVRQTAGAENRVRGATNFQATYNAAASAYFGKAIDPFFNFSGAGASGFTAFRSTLMALKESLRKEISVLFRQTPSASRNDPNSLLENLRTVYNGLPSNFNYSTIQKWVLDNYNVHGSSLAASAGALQNAITFAMTAAQSLNDTQKEKVRRFLFIFQEYYQSASAVLSKITQIVEKMAQKISQ